MDIAELRVSVSKILDLSCSSSDQTVIALAEVALPVLPLAVDDAEDGQNKDANLAAQVDGMTDWVSWCVMLSVCPGDKLVTSTEVTLYELLPSSQNTTSSTKSNHVGG
jgi:hypothetical protein